MRTVLSWRTNISDHFRPCITPRLRGVRMNDPRNLPSFEDVYKSAIECGVADASRIELTNDQLRTLCEIPGLKRLDVSACESLDDNDLTVLSLAKNLEELSVAYTKIGGEGIHSASTLATLQSINLEGCSDLEDEDFAILSRVENLRSLNLTSYITDKGLRFLCSLPRLTRLVLDECPAVTAAGISQLSAIPSLRELSLSKCGAVDFSSKILAAFTQLESLNLSRCEELTDQDFLGVASLQQLKTLQLYGCSRLTDGGLVQLAQLNRLERLLFPGGNRYGDPSIRTLCSIDSLRVLDLRHSRSISGVDLPNLVCMATLESLNLALCDQVEKSSLVGLSVAKSLKHLDLSGCKALTNVGRGLFTGMQSLVELELELTDYHPNPLELGSMEELRHATLEGLDDEQAKALSQLIHLREIKVRDARELTDRGFALLCSLPSLESLDLSCLHSVTDKGFESLRGVETLCTLMVDEAPLVTDVGLQALSTLPALIELDLTDLPNVTARPIEELLRQRGRVLLNVGNCDKISPAALERLRSDTDIQTDSIAPKKEEPIEIFVKHNWLIGTGFDDAGKDDDTESSENLIRYGVAVFANRSGYRYLADHFLGMSNSVPGVSEWDPGDHHHLTPNSTVSDEIEFTTDLVTRGNRATVLRASGSSDATAYRGSAVEQLTSFVAALCDNAPVGETVRVRAELQAGLERLHAAERRLASRAVPSSDT